jgi:hypothetical protein
VRFEERVVLEVVRASDGSWDTRQLDFHYYARSQVLLDPNILWLLRDLERRGLVAPVPIDGGCGPGWRLTRDGQVTVAAAAE